MYLVAIFKHAIVPLIQVIIDSAFDQNSAPCSPGEDKTDLEKCNSAYPCFPTASLMNRSGAMRADHGFFLHILVGQWAGKVLIEPEDNPPKAYGVEFGRYRSRTHLRAKGAGSLHT